MNKGYSDAFPMVVVYQRMVEKAFFKKGYVQSPSGRRYYLSDSWRFYKGGNYLIQGWCADMLKEKMIEVDEWLAEKGLHGKVFMVLCVHDELMFEVPDAKDDWCIPHIQRIMQDLPQVMLPIVAEVEYTETYWSAKKPVIDVESLDKRSVA